MLQHIIEALSESTDIEAITRPFLDRYPADPHPSYPACAWLKALKLLYQDKAVARAISKNKSKRKISRFPRWRVCVCVCVSHVCVCTNVAALG